MTVARAKLSVAAAEELLKGDPDGLREAVRAVPREVPEAGMTDALGAAKGERTAARLGYRSGHDGRTLITRVGKPELRAPQDRDGRFSTELFERCRRSERALVASLAEMGARPPAGPPVPPRGPEDRLRRTGGSGASRRGR
jgi:putative transposase